MIALVLECPFQNSVKVSTPMPIAEVWVRNRRSLSPFRGSPYPRCHAHICCAHQLLTQNINAVAWKRPITLINSTALRSGDERNTGEELTDVDLQGIKVLKFFFPFGLIVVKVEPDSFP
jgi:hypothetical protein